ncbi:MAG: hypothetical protein OTI36_01885 [Beijerinckiaceae bacterium]|nr:hypothetical protein [Beijerinckiaceae bacterium]
MRLEAVRAALDQPMEPRTLARLAADHEFKSTAHLSRSFRAHYGVSPRRRTRRGGRRSITSTRRSAGGAFGKKWRCISG